MSARGGGVSAREGCLLRGSAQDGGVCPGWCLPGGDVCLGRVCQTPPPPVDRMTDRCKNITLDGKSNVKITKRD